MGIVERIYESLDSEEALASLPDAIANEMGARSCTLQLFSPKFELEDSWVNHFDGAMYEFYVENEVQFYDEWTKTNLNKFGVDRTARHTDFLPIEEFKQSLFFQEFIKRFGDDSAYCLGFISSRPDGGYLVAGLQNPLAAPDFSDAQVEDYEKLRSHLTRMLVLRRKLAAREKASSGVLAGINAIEDAYLFVRFDRTVQFANTAAERLLSERQLLSRRHRRLGLFDQRSHHRLVRAMRHAQTREIEGKLSFMARDKLGRQWRFTLAPRYREMTSGVLIWIDRCRIGRTAAQKMKAIYALTDAEVPILLAVSEGLSAAEIAEARQLSITTVRTHIQHLYQKTGVHRASQLATLVATLPKV